jgi:hypothetical protein
MTVILSGRKCYRPDRAQKLSAAVPVVIQVIS